MAEDRSGALDPRFPEVFQRAGASTPALRAPGVPPMPSSGTGRGDAADRRDRSARPVLDAGVASPGAGVVADRAESRAGESGRPERVYEIVAAGNPWLRGMWVLGSLVVAAGIAFQWIAQSMFSTPPPEGQVDYVIPQVLFSLSAPLMTAGAIALVAAASLRMAAWRPRSRREVDAD
ncbi:hypothetical protein [Microcella flavibacter]|uniref:hypothetical protein n=1 Tax=Microcella flavibacter TaxID=1804990 RepID=UPI001457332F|nr:hypothetical protein [Microcella flavibacter]